MGSEVGIEKRAEYRPFLFTISYPADHNQH